MKQEDQEITKEEIKKEFQLERMILFSDAVFAIVITLMAIEIHLPESHEKYTQATFIEALKELGPTIFAYALSFFFIGRMWYRHLQMFSLLKDYDKGLVARNLVFLFFIGLFPFGASLIIVGKGILLPPFIYFCIIILCMSSQLMLQDYILNRSKGITISVDNAEHQKALRRGFLSVAAMVIVAFLAYLTYLIIPKVEDKEYAILWIFVFIITAYFINKKKKKNNAEKLIAKR